MAITKFIPLMAKGKTNRSKKKGGCLTLVNSSKNGKRVVFAENIVEMLGLQDTVDIGFDGKQLLVAKNASKDGRYSLCQQGKKRVVYSAELVRAIADIMELDFSDKVSHTFYDAVIDEFQGQQVAVFSVKEED